MKMQYIKPQWFFYFGKVSTMKHLSNFIVILLCSVIVVVGETDSTQEEESKYFKITTNRHDNYLGFCGGLITGHGLAYRRWIKDKVGFQCNILPWYREDKYPDDDFIYSDRDSGWANEGYINYGGSVLVKFAEMRYLRFIGYVGANHTIDVEKGDYYISDYQLTEPRHIVVDKVENSLAGGLGAGVEFYVFRFGFSVNLGVYAAYNFEDRTKEIMPSVDGGVFFRF